MDENLQPRLASIEETARLLGGISSRAVEHLISRGEIEIIRVYGRKRAVVVDSIDRYIDRLTEQQSA